MFLTTSSPSVINITQCKILKGFWLTELPIYIVCGLDLCVCVCVCVCACVRACVAGGGVGFICRVYLSTAPRYEGVAHYNGKTVLL